MSLRHIHIACIGLFLLSTSITKAQDADDNWFEVDYSTPLTIDLDEQEDILDSLKQRKEKKPKKKVFYGIKTKKGFTKTGFGDNVVVELFYYLKVHEDPDPYVRDIYWYNFKRKKLTNSRKIDLKNGAILHGPYKKMLGDQVLEEGIFYKGTKHGRWMRYNRHDILQAKEKYYKGWPKESQVAYWDKKTRQIREIIPVQFGEKEGYYYAFHENGNLAAMGEYHFDNKVGIWREFYPRRNRRKREIQYPEYAFDEVNKPVILKEWNEKGQVIYDREKYKRTLGQ
ncbi:MAG: hypothetical protein AAGC88_06780 [Bacteroidota bacterium]